LLKDLWELQKKVIKSIFLMDIKEVELAKSLNISRQAVNKTKRSALKKLKNI
jgi:DNA-directed RNA polymerase specialized sigma subunit